MWTSVTGLEESMTETAVEPAAAEIADWLGRFEQALADGDAVAA
jgi:hypothetical protein